MKKRVLILVAVAVLASLALTTVASAKTVEGTGTLWARGAGIAKVHSDGSVKVRGCGVGTVWVKGAECLEAHGVGIRREVAGGVLFIGWWGKIVASGEELTVRMAGGLIEFTAEGTGWAYLRGRGRYHTDSAGGEWSPDGITIYFTP